MKKLLLSLAVVAMIATVSCGDGGKEQARLDSLKKDSIMKDSIAKAEAAAEADKIKADSIAKADSAAKAEEEASKGKKK